MSTIRKDGIKESDVVSQQKENEKLKQIGCFKVKEEIWEGCVTEYLLEKKLSQSRIDGRNGINACTVIASIMAKAFLQEVAVLPAAGLPDAALLSSFINSIRDGNLLYGSSLSARCSGLLGVHDVLKLWPSLKLQPKRNEDFMFHSQEKMEEDLSKWLSDILATKEDRAAVYTGSPYSFCVTVANGRVAVLDSHGH